MYSYHVWLEMLKIYMYEYNKIIYIIFFLGDEE